MLAMFACAIVKCCVGAAHVRSGFITVSKDMLQKHCKKEHRRAWKGETSTLYNKVKVQTFFCTGGLQRYFLVDAADGSDNAPRVPRVVTDVVNERLAEWELTSARTKSRRRSWTLASQRLTRPAS